MAYDAKIFFSKYVAKFSKNGYFNLFFDFKSYNLKMPING